MVKRSSRNWDKLWWFLTGCCLGLFIIYILFSPKGIFYLWQLEKREDKLQTVNKELAEQNRQLREKIELIKKDRSYQEEIARRDLGLVRPNEVIYSFEDKGRNSIEKR